ncbi:flagellar M-ring protein FliF C-terminal domain-containing protein [Shewanella denitrificans]|jgi:flagellar M-ring protein FliF|nr:flagellar M-ring protein FliF C-terminal domain-containing protein [Shewanella denitrificans]
MEKITKKMRFFIAGISLMLLTLITLWWVIQDSKQVLFSGLSQATLTEYTAKLEASGIGYQVEGTSIFVASSDSNQARVVAMEDSIQSNNVTGFELYENSDLGATERAQHANYLRALQGEIERTLTGFNYIKKARVHLTLPQKRLFMSQNQLTKASVTLFTVDHYQPRTIDIEAIKQLVVSAVEDLTIDQVVVIDGAGQWGVFEPQGDLSSPNLALRRSTESYLEQKVLQVLVAYFSASSISAAVAVELNTDTVKIHETKAIKGDGSQGLISSETKFEETHLSDDNKPGSKTLRNEVTYAHGALTQETEQAPGQILRLTAAVSINAEVAPELQAQISELIKNTIGFDSQRDDSISVSFFYLPKVEPLPVTPMAVEPVVVKTVESNTWWPFLLIGLGTLFSLSTGMFYLANKRDSTEQQLLNQINYLFDNEQKAPENA